MTHTQKTERPTPVTDSENRDAKGLALACKIVHDGDQAKIKALRERQAAYVADLPKEPLDALTEINRALCDTRDVGEEEYGARAAFVIIHRLATHQLLDGDNNLNDAVYWLALAGLDSLDKIEAGNLHSRAIAGQFNKHDHPFEA